MILDMFFGVGFNPSFSGLSCIGVVLFSSAGTQYQNRVTPILKEEIAKVKYGTPMEG
jgi:hypothetical protein